MYYLGIDPGVTGAYALYKSPQEYVVFDWCGDDLQIIETIGSYDVLFGVLELITPRKLQAVQSTATQFENYGQWKTICKVCGVPFSLEKPSEWRKLSRVSMPIYTNSPKLTKEKNAYNKKKMQKKFLLNLGRQRFPKADLSKESHVDRAEALLIAQAAYHIMQGQHEKTK